MARIGYKRDFSPIISAAQNWIEVAMINDGSVLSEEKLWTAENARELERAFVQRPDEGEDSFMEKLERQLSDATPSSIRLMAEMLWIVLLFPARITPEKKRALITDIWRKSGATLNPASPYLSDEILLGVGSAGLAFNNYRPKELEFLISLVIDLKAIPQPDRSTVFRDYERFVSFVSEREDQGHRQLRHMLRYFAFPDRVEPISSSRERRNILHTFRDIPLQELNGWDHARLDAAMLQLRRDLEQQSPGKVIDFYEPGLRKRWSKNGATSVDEDEKDPAERARSIFKAAYPDFVDFQNPGEKLRRAELDRKRKALDKFAAEGGRAEVLRLLDAAQPVNALRFIRRCVDVNLASFRSWRVFDEAAPHVIDEVLRVTLRVTEHAYQSAGTLAPLFEVLERHQMKPNSDALSVLLWAARPEDYFPFKVSYYYAVADLLDLPVERGRITPSSFDAILKMGRHVRTLLEAWHARDWIDVQTFLWVVGDNLKGEAGAPDVETDEPTTIDGVSEEPAKYSATSPAATTGPRNLIFYGPPGTGKSRRLLAIMQEYEDPPEKVDAATWLQGALSHVGWRPVIAAALADLGGSTKVGALVEHRWIKAKALQRGRATATPQTLWGYLQEHTPESVETVKNAVRRPPFLFTKSEESVWSLLPDWRDADPESAELLATLKAGAKASRASIKRYRTVTFHPSYSYEDFVRGIRPVISESTGVAQFEPVNGVFKQLCDEARANPGRRFALFIDEINRGNIAKIFGELITLIEADKRIAVDSAGRILRGVTVQLPGTDPETDQQADFGVPENIDIYGTMNTADRSVAMIDIALRRRFTFEEIEPDCTILKTLGSVDLAKLLQRINERLEFVLDRDHRIGHAYFCKVASLEQLRDVFSRQIIPLLQEYFFDDVGKVALVLTTAPNVPPFVRRRCISQRSLFGETPIDRLPIERDVFEITAATSWTEASFTGLYA